MRLSEKESVLEPVTQKLIATRSGASPSLVSRILGGKLERHIIVSEEKLLRILRVSRELGYQRENRLNCHEASASKDFSSGRVE